MFHPIDPQILAGIGMLGLSVCLVVLGRLRGRKVVGPTRPRRLGPYTLGDKIGQGAMGEVYRARHGLLGRWCAIKLLSDDVSRKRADRFEKEVQLTAQLSHPNTVSIYDCGRTADGTFYYAMELLDGISLQELVDEHGPQPPARVIHILRQLCAALREAHGLGLIHRDIKPDNVLLCRQGGVPDVAKLLDFGLVKEVGNDSRTSQSSNLVVGTPLYMSPEAIAAPETVGARSDLYALGAVAHFLVTGKPVFEGTNLIEVCSHHLHSEPAPLSEAADQPIAADLERLVLDCLSKNPLERPASAAELARRLERCVDAADWSEAHAEHWWTEPTSSAKASYTESFVRRLDRLDALLEEAMACA